MRRLPLCLNLTLILSLIFIIPVFAGSTTLTTYYPSPSGNYDNLTTSKMKINFAEGVNYNVDDPCNDEKNGMGAGSLYINTNGDLKICDPTNVQKSSQITWIYDNTSNPNSVYLNQDGAFIGIGPSKPKYILDLGSKIPINGRKLAIYSNLLTNNFSGLGGSATALDLFAGPTIKNGTPVPALATLTSDGKLGIGDGQAAPTATQKFDINVIASVLTIAKLGTTAPVFIMSSSDSSAVGFNTYRDNIVNGTYKAYTQNGYTGLVEQNPTTGVLTIKTSTSPAAASGDAANLQDRLTVTPNGNVGIAGPIDPLTNVAGNPTLTVNGDIKATGLVDARVGLIVPVSPTDTPPDSCKRNGATIDGCFWIKN